MDCHKLLWKLLLLGIVLLSVVSTSTATLSEDESLNSNVEFSDTFDNELSSSFTSQDELSDNEYEKLYSYDDIKQALQIETSKFFQDVAQSHHLGVPSNKRSPSESIEESIVLSRRKRSSAYLESNEQTIPDHLLNGIWPLKSIVESDSTDSTQNLCPTSGTVIDFQMLEFDSNKYVLCLTRDISQNYTVRYGPLGSVVYSVEINSLSSPRRLLAFTSYESHTEDIVLLVLGQKKQPDEIAVSWTLINTAHNVFQAGHLSGLYRLNLRNCLVLPQAQVLVFHDVHQGLLKVFQYNNGHFDPSGSHPVEADLNIVIGFEESESSYIVLGHRNLDAHREQPRDIELLTWNSYLQRFTRSVNTRIACEDDVLDAVHFTLGRGVSRENFLATVEPEHIVFYKKAVDRYIVFQRLPMTQVRRISAIGNRERLFALALVFNSNSVHFVTYNSLVFHVAPTQKRIFVHQEQHSTLVQIEENVPVFNFLVQRSHSVESFELTFYHDTSLLDAWKSNLQWCKSKRREMLSLEKQTHQVEHRFSRAFFNNEPFAINGSITVPNFIVGSPQATIQADTYRRIHPTLAEQQFQFDQNYFDQLAEIDAILRSIDHDLNNADARLDDALLHSSLTPQHITGNYVFDHLRIHKFDGLLNNPLVVETEHLNGQEVHTLHDDTIRIRQPDSTHVTFIRPMSFAHLDTTNAPINVINSHLVNNRYNVSNIVTSDGSGHNQIITGRKNLKNILIVDDTIYARRVNGNNFTSDSVLTTIGDQFIQNQVRITSTPTRARILDVPHTINDAPISPFLESFVKKDRPGKIETPVEFAAPMDAFDLSIVGPFNGNNVEKLAFDTLWINQPNQTLSGEYVFKASLKIDRHLFASRINDKNIPEDLVLASGVSHVRGRKSFENNRLFTQQLIVKNSLNGLSIDADTGAPDLILKHRPQNITGFKQFDSLHIRNHSFVGGLINGVSLDELARRIQSQPNIQQLDKLVIDRFADFQNGFLFEHLNGLTRQQFERLFLTSVALNSQWEDLDFENVHFRHLTVNNFNCDRINDLSLETDLLTLNSSQTIFGEYQFAGSEVRFQNPSSLEALNRVPLDPLDNLFRIFGDQELGSKTFAHDVSVHSLRVKNLNSIPFDQIVFVDSLHPKVITGLKRFDNSALSIGSLKVGDLNVPELARVPVERLLHGTLRKTSPQHVSAEMHAHSLQVVDNFATFRVNGVDIRHLADDVVLHNVSHLHQTSHRFQNITAPKVFKAPVWLDEVTFSNFLDSVSDWEMRNDWLLQGVPQRVDSSFTIEKLIAPMAVVDNEHLNEHNLEWAEQNVARRDRKTVFHSPIEFVGLATAKDHVQLNGLLNGIDLREDVVRYNSHGLQTIRGNVSISGGPVHILGDLDLRSTLNGHHIPHLCRSVYRPAHDRNSLHIAGNVVIQDSLEFGSLNNLTLEELAHSALRHDIPNQVLHGRRIIDTLVLNGPSLLDGTLNNFNLTHLAQSYMSKTRDQIVDVGVTLNGEQIIRGDLLVHRSLQTGSGFIDGLNLSQIEAHALRRFGEQHYPGNLEFESPINIESSLNAKWINDFDTDFFLSRNRQEKTFVTETEFSNSVRVVDNVNILKRKTVGGVDIDRLLHAAVRRNSPAQNFTVRGRKIFEDVQVNIVHTQRLNKIQMSKHHLLLKNENQEITGQMEFQGNLDVKQLFVDSLNSHRFNEFSDNLVKKSRNNTILTPVNFHFVEAQNIRALSLVDNVNISVLNQISETVAYLKNIHDSSSLSRSEFEHFERELSQFSSKFMFFEQIDQYSGLLPPDSVQRVGENLVVVSQEAILPEQTCQRITVQVYNSDASKSFRLEVGGRILKTQLFGDYLVTVFVPTRLDTGHCWDSTRQVLLKHPSDSNLAVQVDQILVRQQKSLLDRVAWISGAHVSGPLDSDSVHFLRDNLVLVCTKKQCTLLCLTCSASNDASSASVVVGSLKLSAPISTLVSDGRSLLTMIDEDSRVQLFRFDSSSISLVASMFVFNVQSALLVHEPRSTASHQTFLLLNFRRSSQYQTRRSVHLYGVDFESKKFVKTQELSEDNVSEMSVLYTPTGRHSDAYILLLSNSKSQISTYRLFASGVLVKLDALQIEPDLRYWTVNNHNELALFTSPMSVKNHSKQSRLRILRTCFRQSVLYGQQSLHTESEFVRRSHSAQNSTVFMNAIV